MVTAIACASSTVPGTAQRASLSEVLARAGAYVEEFQRQLSGIVAEETYLQEVVPVLGMNAIGRMRFQRRRLRSDLLLLRPEGSISWVQFRDVFEVDGKPLRDREERLTALFLEPTPSTAQRVNRIRSESARYNIGDIERTMNVPVLPLAVLDPENQPRFRFTIDDVDTRTKSAPASADGLPGTPSFTVSTEVWVVRYVEVKRPTLVHAQAGADIFSRGRFWIEPASGQVLMSEMITENDDVRGQINISYQSEPLLGLLVPIEMRERYTKPGYRATITGQATYGKFREFQVQVDENIAPIR
jgi:hypothetical protein